MRCIVNGEWRRIFQISVTQSCPLTQFIFTQTQTEKDEAREEKKKEEIKGESKAKERKKKEMPHWNCFRAFIRNERI